MIIELRILIAIVVVGLAVWIFLISLEKRANRSEQKLARANKAVKDNIINHNSLWDIAFKHPQAEEIKRKLEEVIIGQSALVNALILSLFAGKHMLIQSLPGMAKTMAIKTLAQITGLKFGRIQWTPDLLPSDIVWLENAQTHEISKWPIFANIILFDEINRTTPKVQSAFIQAMEEGQVTIWHQTLDLPKPFLVFATSNPAGSKGVYDLPEAQLDRFGMCIRLDYPENEKNILKADSNANKSEQRTTEANNNFVGTEYFPSIESDYKKIQQIEASDEIIEYISWIIQKTRNTPEILVGCSPRSAKDLLWLAKTLARLKGKDVVEFEDIDSLIDLVLWHRITRKRGEKRELSEIL